MKGSLMRNSMKEWRECWCEGVSWGCLWARQLSRMLCLEPQKRSLIMLDIVILQTITTLIIKHNTSIHQYIMQIIRSSAYSRISTSIDYCSCSCSLIYCLSVCSGGGYSLSCLLSTSSEYLLLQASLFSCCLVSALCLLFSVCSLQARILSMRAFLVQFRICCWISSLLRLIMRLRYLRQMELSVLLPKQGSLAISFQEKACSGATYSSRSSIYGVQRFLPTVGSMMLQKRSRTCSSLLTAIFCAISAHRFTPQCSSRTSSMSVSLRVHRPVRILGLILLWNSQYTYSKLRPSTYWQIFSQLSRYSRCFSIITPSYKLVQGRLGARTRCRSSHALQSSSPLLQRVVAAASWIKLISEGSRGRSARCSSLLRRAGFSSLSFFMNSKSSSLVFLMASCSSSPRDCSLSEAGVFRSNLMQLSILLAGGHSVRRMYVLMNSSRLCSRARMSSRIAESSVAYFAGSPAPFGSEPGSS